MKVYTITCDGVAVKSVTGWLAALSAYNLAQFNGWNDRRYELLDSAGNVRRSKAGYNWFGHREQAAKRNAV